MKLSSENTDGSLKLPLYLEDGAKNFHECNMFKVILIEEGSTILNINDKPAVLSAPALLCLNESESCRIEKEESLVARVIYFCPSVVNSSLNTENVYNKYEDIPYSAKFDHFYFMPFVERQGSYFGQIDIGPITARKVSTLFDSLKAQIENRSDLFWPCRNRAFLIEILFIIQHSFSDRHTYNVDLQKATKSSNDVILYLHLNYSRKITIEELTKEFHTNRNTLNMRFRKETGLSVVEYIVKLRIKIACMLLRDTSLPVTEIMDRVGFEDVSYWGRTFKKLTGLSPTDYRKTYVMEGSTHE